ncbi:patatin-like phospholipase family protein [Cognataquiflexum rubidum]|uniref:patatin-like phospholipase family protein n=1 Tax=Cognataquiflexum rubidum TaxID=2922273 RepID=UPI001F13DB00|nr:patatin-like phospholipase family protein [Cognataquiflexum rubidum]MCH6232875.1 patatin-like phospholipase family protein [Cognataquiflexum rubidum]
MKKLLLSSLLIFIVFFLQAQEKENADRPKIGLVLSGGGAKGMAHVGILRYMEKAGIRPDFIVGTSMGSVVGGLYALGYSADELEQIILNIDWDILITNRVGFNDISFEEKEYYNRYLVELPVIEGKVSLPSGLIHGQMLSETLHYYTWPANNIESFDDFPIPFRCITTDVKTGEGIVLKDGYLHDALRASIAIPTFFTPFDMDSTLVVDGGVVNNFPVDVVKEMGADIIIGVNVGDEDFVNPKDIGSFSGILMQIAMSKSYSRLRQNIQDTDIYIKPDLKNYSTGSFSKFREILELGDLAGQKHAQKFKNLADSLDVFVPTTGIGLDVAPIVISDIEVKGNSLFSDVLIKSKLNIKAGETVTRQELREGMSRVFGINGFYNVDYSLIKTGEDNYQLVIRANEKPKSLLFASVHYDNQFSAGILLNLTMRDVLGKSSRSIILADISQNPKFRFDYYKYIGPQKKYAFNFKVNYLNQQAPVYEDGKETDINVNKESRVGAHIMSTQSLKETFVVGGFYENNQAKSKFNISSPSDVRNAVRNFMGLRFMYYRNSLNDRNYATRGAEAIVEPVYLFNNNFKINLNDGVDTLFIGEGDSQVGIPKEDIPFITDLLTPKGYFAFYFKYIKYFPLARNLQIMPTAATGLTFSNENAFKVFDGFIAGGHQRVRFNDTRIWGLNYRELVVPNFAKLGLEFQYIPVNNIFLRTGANFVGYSEHVPLKNGEGSIISEMESNNLFGYGVDITYKSILGPIIAGVGKNNSDENLRFYFSIGFSFGYSDR